MSKYEDNQGYTGHVVTAQPVVVASSTVGYGHQPTIVVTPEPGPAVGVQANNVSAYGQPSAPQMQQPRRVRPVAGRWADNICDWPKNLFPSCWCACCCCNGMWIVSQMAEKTQLCTFQGYFGAFCCVWLLAIILQAALGGSFIIWLPAVIGSMMAIALRLHIVRKYQITECSQNPCCNEFMECCCGFWCWYCSVAQMARHVYGYSKVLDGDSDIHRDDNYERV